MRDGRGEGEAGLKLEERFCCLVTEWGGCGQLYIRL